MSTTPPDGRPDERPSAAPAETAAAPAGPLPPDGNPAAEEQAADEERLPPAGPVANLLVAGIVVALGAAGLAGSLNLGLGRASQPGPGLWPALVSVLLAVLGLILAVRARSTDDAERFTRTGLLVVAAVATMVVYVAVIGVIGFEIPTAVLAFVWLRFLGHEAWRTSIILALAMTAAFYALFVGALDVTIPHVF